ncbi:hypothetical protein HPB50_008764 [Hyalomma asiaticum]|uniref:Uncharacterized protein n=1 Tax=Hyalomma asiaticum TaxID=266040 RepID=A0ACB7SU07_HYAAI|nr:hypothetical protein HPB50_008764 [Hyalomma asiaticum]
MSSVDRLEAFDASTSERPQYHECVLLYFAANDVAEDKKNAVFPTSCGAATYSSLRNLLSPTKWGDSTLAAIFAALGAHFKPKVLEVDVQARRQRDRRRRGNATLPHTRGARVERHRGRLRGNNLLGVCSGDILWHIRNLQH